MPKRRVSVRAHSAPLRSAFTISRGSKTEAITVQVEITENNVSGRGESVPYSRYGESLESVMGQIEAIRLQLEAGLDKHALQSSLPNGAARCAVDCALWDLEAKLTGIPVWKRAGLTAPKPVETAETVSLDTPTAMAKAAKAVKGSLLKLKLGPDLGVDRIQAVHEARPDARLILDANEGLAISALDTIAAQSMELGVTLLEQPLPATDDAKLQKGRYAIPLCADESVHTSADIERVVPFYDSVNIKLDKAGGFTEALKMLRVGRNNGMGVMIGCMVAGSLSMAPAVLLAAVADYADLDGPLWLETDCDHGLIYKTGWIDPPLPSLWG